MAKLQLDHLPPWHQHLCRQLRAIRKQSGLTLKQAALQLQEAGHKVYQPDLSDYERGQMMPSLERLYALSTLYDVDVDVFLSPRAD